MNTHVKSKPGAGKTLSFSTMASFGICLLLCTVLITVTVVNRNNVERLEMEQLIMEKSVRISDVISRLLYKTEALAALVVQGNGEMENFERVAATICDDPAIMNVLIAPEGVVSAVYPIQGNAAVMGLDFFSEGQGNNEAVMAKNLGQLVFGGPFALVQGGQALVGRLPVYLDDQAGQEAFWGLVSVTLRYPEALKAVGLELLETQGYAYEIWRYSPDDGQVQVIANGDMVYNESARFIEMEIHILNATWYFKVAPVRMWYQYFETWVLITAGLLVSLLVAFVTQNNAELRRMKLQIERIAHQDSLTDIYTRRYFMENAAGQVKQRRQGCIIIFDVDQFKQINDTYGHSVGDEVLIGIARRVGSKLRAGDIFARYGGEEFIIYLPDAAKEQSLVLAKRLSKTISQEPIETRNASIHVTASFGVAAIGVKQNLEEAINWADGAMYEAKRNGRNQVAASVQ